MKLLIAILFTSLMSAQVSYDAYVPLKTYHFDRNDSNLWWMNDNEGGNIGLIIIRREGISELQFGAINNSYGDLSFIAMGGITKRIGWFRVGASVGIATGYQGYYKAMEFGNLDKQNNIFSRTGTLPQAAINISLEKHKFSPLIVISPFFINAGIRYNFK